MGAPIQIHEDRITKTLLHAENVKLLSIPPPRTTAHSRDGLYDVSTWDWGKVVWSGKLRFVEDEFLDDRPDNITARAELVNYGTHEEVFGVVHCDLGGENIKQTHSRRAFRVLIDHGGMKIALGLVFDDSFTANSFVSAINSFKKNYNDTMGAKQDLMEDLHDGVTKLTINGDCDPQQNGRYDAYDEDDDDDFGEFVTSTN